MPDHGHLPNHQDDNFGNDDDDEDEDDNNDDDDDNDNYSDGNQGRAAESYPLVTRYVQHLNVTPSNQLVADEFFDVSEAISRKINILNITHANGMVLSSAPPDATITARHDPIPDQTEFIALYHRSTLVPESFYEHCSSLPTDYIIEFFHPVIEPHDDQASAWAPGEPLKKTARTYMLDSTVEAYTQGPGANDEAPSGTLLTLVMLLAESLTSLWQSGQVVQSGSRIPTNPSPPKTGEHGESRDQLVTCVVKDILRQVRNKARNVILAGMVEQQTKVKVPGIPDIDKLSRLLWRHLTGNKSSKSNTQIDKLLTPEIKESLQWLEIDSLLAALRGQSHEYIKVWRLLVSERDHELFATSPMYDDSTSATLQTKLCPTDADVHALMLNQPCC
ncbi:hypothetical protein PSTT_10023 [Puccinia striiformis]|uniref:Uncharacterized protein n=1 Tax=Puccinia striiformis TaxID=27350 RepID=A0A2S4V603_9BASI|nr:hypothetical protein PSTT_10023 [Puccinia striiformis]